jgi:hypothetical protein
MPDQEDRCDYTLQDQDDRNIQDYEDRQDYILKDQEERWDC